MSQLMGETEQRLVYVLFVPQVMPLQLDIKPLFKNIIQPRKICLSAAVLYAVVHKAVRPARKTHQAGRNVLRYPFAWRNARLFCCEA